MIDVNFLSIKRMIVHRIIAKLPERDTATTELSTEILKPNDTVVRLLTERLVDATGRNSRAFELKIRDTHEGTFFDLATKLYENTDTDFVLNSSSIANSLAYSQTRNNIPGGFLLVLDCFDLETGFQAVVVIKAEPHEALQLSQKDGHSQLNLLEKVFLSPSQKFFKIGIIYRKSDEDSSDIDDKFGCFIYDDQFRTESRPAEYFYDEFLGFSIGENSKIQSQRFYDKSSNFIKSANIDYEKKVELLDVLVATFTTNTLNTISPTEFAKEYIPAEGGLRDQFIGDVCADLPLSIVKDKALIKKRLVSRKIDFPLKINIAGPIDNFDSNVEIISDRDSLLDLDVDSGEYTIVKITGRPFGGNGG